MLLALPSLVETVGLPLLESMSLGVPVVAADRPYAREICGDAAEFFDPKSSESFAASAGRLLEDRGSREMLKARGIARSKQMRLMKPYQALVAALCDLAKA